MLHELGLKYGTDKATHHGYTHVYHDYFKDRRESVKNVLEIGTGYGPSVQMWKDYFPNATIYTVDVRDIYKYGEDDRVVRGIYNFGKRYDKDKAFTHLEYKMKGNDNSKGIDTFKKDFPIEFDIIIEDASHMMKDQQQTLSMLFDQVKPGGIYVLEDLATSHKLPRWARYKQEGDTNTLDMLHQFNETGGFESVHMTQGEINFLNDNVAYCEIHERDTSMRSTLAFIGRKYD